MVFLYVLNKTCVANNKLNMARLTTLSKWQSYLRFVKFHQNDEFDRGKKWWREIAHIFVEKNRFDSFVPVLSWMKSCNIMHDVIANCFLESHYKVYEEICNVKPSLFIAPYIQLVIFVFVFSFFLFLFVACFVSAKYRCLKLYECFTESYCEWI